MLYSHVPHILLEYCSKKNELLELHSCGWISKYYVEQKEVRPPKCIIHDFIYMMFENRQRSQVIDIRKWLSEGRKRRRLPGKTAQGMFYGGRNVFYTLIVVWNGCIHLPKLWNVYFVCFRVYKLNVNKTKKIFLYPESDSEFLISLCLSTIYAWSMIERVKCNFNHISCVFI